jgi:p-aminobenzoyl-glutamate transporter AbgT
VDMQELMDRLLGFMPKHSVFWSATATFFLIFIIKYVVDWLIKMTRLPWMQEENQKRRQELIQSLKKKQN